MATDRIAKMAIEILGHAKDALSGQGLTVPGRAFVAHNIAAADCCEQLTVYVPSLSHKLLGRGDPQLAGRLVVAAKAQFGVTLWRSCPVTDEQGYPVVPYDELQADALARLTEMWAIWSWLTRLWATNKLFSQEAAAITPNATPVSWDSGTLLGPQGGMSGFRILFTVDVPAINEALAAS